MASIPLRNMSAPKKAIFLHIGPPKTGTSAIQVFLARNTDTLLRYGFEYPLLGSARRAKTGEITSGNAVRLAKFLNPDHPMEYEPEQALKDFCTLIINNNNNVIFSSENMFQARTERLAILKNVADDNGFSINIIAYLRNIFDVYVSLHSQRVKRHRYTKDIDTFVRENRVDHFSKIKDFVSVFGVEIMNLRAYDAVCSDLAGDFLRAIGINQLDDFVFSDEKINPLLTPTEDRILREMNKYFSEKSMSKMVSDYLLYNRKQRCARAQISNQTYELIFSRHVDEVAYANEHLLPKGTHVPFFFDNVRNEDREPEDGLLTPKDEVILQILALLVEAVSTNRKELNGIKQLVRKEKNNSSKLMTRIAGALTKSRPRSQ